MKGHDHTRVDRQQSLVLYGGSIVDPRAPATSYHHALVVLLQEWLHRDGYTCSAMPAEGAPPTSFTVNVKVHPASDTVRMVGGERLLVRVIGLNSGIAHPMHIHGGPVQIAATDSSPVPPGAHLTNDPVHVAPDERYDVLWQAREPGRRLLPCRISRHTTNHRVEERGAGV